MKVNGIIAEYNPFHNGHKYLLEEAKRISGADYTIIALSGNFVQRGGPALLDKHSRTEMALRGGADLVLELPAIYSASSAEYFAQGAVSLLSSLNVITNLCFGCECGDIALLSHIAKILAEEPADFSQLMKYYLRQGFSYPYARSSALMQYCPELSSNRSIFSSANNILAIEYIKATLRRKSSLKPMAIKRIGPGYHSLIPAAQYCSALSIRQALWEQENDASCVQAYIPESAAQLLTRRIAEKRIVRSNHFSSALYYKLLSEKEDGYEKYLDVSQSLSNRIVNSLDKFVSFDDFCNLLKTRELTYTRISRCLLHILLNITKEDMALCAELGQTPYARILGFRRSASPLLSVIKKNTSIPLITKLADAEKKLDEDAVNMLKQDTQISQLYHGVVAGLTGSEPLNEFTIPLVIL